ncbi:MAG: response regulator [Nitrospirota bacterium]
MESFKKKAFIVTDYVEGELIKDMIKEEYITLMSKNKDMAIIDEIREEKPDIIIYDYSIKEIDSEDFLIILKGDEKTQKIPIVLLYSEGTNRSKDREYIASYIKRPIDKENLKRAIHNASNIPAEKKGEKRILIVDDDIIYREEIRKVMENIGYEVDEAKTGLDAINIINKKLPDLIVLDVILPDIDGFKILNRLKEDISTKHVPVILLSSIEKAEEKAKGIILGAADFITKPFSAIEFSARIEMLLERTEEEYSASPTTRLPGNISIEKAIMRRIAKKLFFAACYCDLDNFKAYNDTYGFSKGDIIIRLTAQIIMEAMKKLGNNDDFLGHIGGDDFILITTPDKVDQISKKIIDTFDRIIPFYYAKEARKIGYIESLDRQGRQNRFPIMTISIVVVSNVNREIRHIGEVSDISAELKKYAKMQTGSKVVKDRRR